MTMVTHSTLPTLATPSAPAPGGLLHSAPFARGVAIVLLVALLAGSGLATSLVSGGEARIAQQTEALQAAQARQAALAVQHNATITLREEARTQAELGLAAQALALQQAREALAAQRRVGAVEGKLIEAYAALTAQHAAAAQARQGAFGEVEEATAVAAAAVARTEDRIERLLAQRTVLLSTPRAVEAP
jgi:hypothetical protein